MAKTTTARPAPQTQSLVPTEPVRLTELTVVPASAAAFLEESAEPVERANSLPTTTIDHREEKFLLPSGEMVDEVSGYVLYYYPTRRYYKEPPKTGEGKPPDCWSGDMDKPHRSIKSPQHPTCLGCKCNDYGTARGGGKGKACGTYHYLFLLNPQFGTMPLTALYVGPSNIKILFGTKTHGGYFSQAQIKHGAFQVVWTTFSLERAGDLHCTVVPRMGPVATPEDGRIIAQLRKQFREMMDSFKDDLPVEDDDKPPTQQSVVTSVPEGARQVEDMADAY